MSTIAPHIELAKKVGTGIAIENLYDDPKESSRRYS